MGGAGSRPPTQPRWFHRWSVYLAVSVVFAVVINCLWNNEPERHRSDVFRWESRDVSDDRGPSGSSQLLRPPSASNIQYLPENLIHGFVPRLSILDQAADALSRCPSHNALPCAILFHGPGGSGKTQMALSIVQEWKKTYHTIFWIDARDILGSFQRFAALLGMPVAAEDRIYTTFWWHSPSVQKVFRYFEQTSVLDQRWLIVIDDITDLSWNEAQAIIPRVPNGHVISTSQLDLDCLHIEGCCQYCQGIKVGNLTPEESSTLILRRLYIEREEASAEILDLSAELGQMVGNLALGVHMIVNYLAFLNGNDPVEKLVRCKNIYEQYEDYMLEREPFRKLNNYPFTIGNVWDSALRRIQSQDPDATKLLTLLSVFDHSIIQDDIFRLASQGFTALDLQKYESHWQLPPWMTKLIRVNGGEWDGFALKHTVRLLEHYSLVSRESGPQTGTVMHKMVQWRVQQSFELEQWCDPLIVFITSALGAAMTQPGEMQYRKMLLPHILRLQKHGIPECRKNHDKFSAYAQQVYNQFLFGEGV